MAKASIARESNISTLSTGAKHSCFTNTLYIALKESGGLRATDWYICASAALVSDGNQLAGRAAFFPEKLASAGLRRSL
jgi:hypothetical protein